MSAMLNIRHVTVFVTLAMVFIAACRKEDNRYAGWDQYQVDVINNLFFPNFLPHDDTTSFMQATLDGKPFNCFDGDGEYKITVARGQATGNGPGGVINTLFLDLSRTEFGVWKPGAISFRFTTPVWVPNIHYPIDRMIDQVIKVGELPRKLSIDTPDSSAVWDLETYLVGEEGGGGYRFFSCVGDQTDSYLRCTHFEKDTLQDEYHYKVRLEFQYNLYNNKSAQFLWTQLEDATLYLDFKVPK
jgi:hypothetical protein